MHKTKTTYLRIFSLIFLFHFLIFVLSQMITRLLSPPFFRLLKNGAKYWAVLCPDSTPALSSPPPSYQPFFPAHQPSLAPPPPIGPKNKSAQPAYSSLSYFLALFLPILQPTHYLIHFVLGWAKPLTNRRSWCVKIKLKKTIVSPFD